MRIFVLQVVVEGFGVAVRVLRIIAVARRAVQSNMFPLWECEAGRFALSYDNREPISIAEFVKGIRKFKNLGESELEALQSSADRRWTLIKRLCES